MDTWRCCARLGNLWVTPADGPYLLIGSTEYTVAEGKALGASLIALPKAHI